LKEICENNFKCSHNKNVNKKYKDMISKLTETHQTKYNKDKNNICKLFENNIVKLNNVRFNQLITNKNLNLFRIIIRNPNVIDISYNINK